MPELTPEQKAKESAVFFTCAADVVIESLLIVFAFATLSLTLISEAIRGALNVSLDLYTFVVLRAVHRGRLRRYRFGIGKVEQICNVAVGGALLLSGFWVAHRVVDTVVFGSASAATPFGLATAAAVNAINLVINGLGWLALLAAATKDDSAIYRGQLRARSVKMVSSGILQATMTAAAIAQDPVISMWLDGFGAGFVAILMVIVGVRMIAEAMPDLLDHPIPEDQKREIDAALVSAGIDAGTVVGMRTRQGGVSPQVELTLAPSPAESVAEFIRRAAGIERRVRDRIEGADVAVAIDVPER
jgi:divalent metal cation (Fe/Co/Zn/Cd) transporter